MTELDVPTTTFPARDGERPRLASQSLPGNHGSNRQLRVCQVPAIPFQLAVRGESP